MHTGGAPFLDPEALTGPLHTTPDGVGSIGLVGGPSTALLSLPCDSTPDFRERSAITGGSLPAVYPTSVMSLN